MRFRSIAYSRFQEEILKLYEPPLRRASTWFKMRKVLTEFGALKGVETTADITPSAIGLWLAAHSTRAPLSNYTYLGTFRTACNIGRKHRWLRLTPWDVRKDWVTFDFDEEDEEDLRPVRHLSMAEIQTLLSALDGEARGGDWRASRLRALVYTYVYTGLRKCEALGLKVADLVPEGVIRIRSRRIRKMKTRGSARLVGIPSELGEVLDPWVKLCGSEWLFPGFRRSTPWLHGAPGYRPLDRIQAAAERAGIGHVTIQALRRSIATHSRRLGINREEVAGLLGHDSVKTQEWYVEEDLENAKDVASRIHFRPRP
jgi:integrase